MFQFRFDSISFFCFDSIFFVSIVYSRDLLEAREFSVSIVVTRTNKSLEEGRDRPKFFLKRLIERIDSYQSWRKISSDAEGQDSKHLASSRLVSSRE